MAKKKNRQGMWRVLSGVSATLFAFLIGGNSVAAAYATWLSAALATPTEKIVNDSGETPYYYSSDYKTLAEMLEARSELLKEISAEGSTLLKNKDAVLPLDGTAKVTLLGYSAYDPIFGGVIGSSTTEGGTQKNTSLIEAMENAGFSVNPAMTSFYEKNVNATEYVKGYSDYDAAAEWNYNSQVSYSFGYGLSYTTFTQKLDNIVIDSDNGTGTAAVTVSNTGNRDGKSVVQLYVQAPYEVGGVEKSAVQLVDFGKVDVSEGETVTTEITFDLNNFASYDTENERWILDEGEYYFAVGNGSHEALNSILLAQGAEESSLSISTEEEKGSVEQVIQITLNNLERYLAVINKNVKNRFVQADYSTYDKDYRYMTRSDWSVGWETIGTVDGLGDGAVTYTEEMKNGLFAKLYEITENEKTEDMTFAWDSGAGLIATEFIGVGLDETITKDGTEYNFDDLINCMSLYEASYLLENQYQNLDSVTSINLGECVTNDGPA